MAAFYDGYDYTLYWEGRDYEHASEAIALTHFFNRIGKKQKIADVGCGFGRLTPLYRKFAKDIYLAEPSKELLQKAKKRLISKKNSVIHFIQSTIHEVDKKVPPVDTLLMIRVMHHVTNADDAFLHLAKTIKPGGHLILEFANKMHGKAQIKELFRGNILYPFDIFPNDRRSAEHMTDAHIDFVNYHPDIIRSLLKKHGFNILETRSVSNIRSRKMKRFIPMKALLTLEKLLQKPLAYVNFGPSIFILATKEPLNT